MDTPLSKLVSNNMVKVCPKLPLYSRKKTEKISQSKSVTLDDILRTVKTLDATSYAQKGEKPVTFSKSDDNLKKFQPSSSLDNMNISSTDPVLVDSCMLREFSEWEYATNDPVTPTKSLNNDESNDESQRSPVLLSTVGAHVDKSKENSKTPSSSTDDKLLNSQSVVSFKSLLCTQPLLESSFESNISKEKKITGPLAGEDLVDHSLVSNDGIVEKVGTDQAFASVFNDPKVVNEKVGDKQNQDQRLAPIVEDNWQGTSVENGKSTNKHSSPSPVGYSQRSFDNEANAALSVFEVSDFLTCSKTGTTRKNLLSQFGSSKESSRSCSPPTLPVKFTGTIVKTSTHNEKVPVNHDVQLSFREEKSQEVSAGVIVNPGFTATFDEDERRVEENLSSVSQLQGGMELVHTTAPFQKAEAGVTSSEDSRCLEQSHKKTMFTSSTGKPLSISSENPKKAALIFEACNNDSPETSYISNKAQTDLPTKNDNSFPQPSTSSEIPNPATGFITARGKHICVSQKSLNFASSLLESLDNGPESGESSSKPSTSTAQTTNPRSKSPNHQQFRKSLFNTASGKNMTVSSVNLQKAKSLLDECSDEDPGFNTSGGKPVRSPDKSQNCASRLLETREDGVSSSLPCNKPHEAARAAKSKNYRKSMFQSASGKSTSVSTENLRKAKNLLDSLDECSTEDNSASKRPKVSQKGEDKNDSTSSAKCFDFCTPENAGLLDNDNELFQTIETPSKSKNAASGSSSVTNEDVPLLRGNGLASSCLEQRGGSFSGAVSSEGDLDVDLHRSQTVFNESGIATQRKNCDAGKNTTLRPSFLPEDIEACPATKSSIPMQKSPVLLRGSFMGTPSPRRLPFKKEILYEGKGINVSSTSSCLFDQKSPSRVESPPLKKFKPDVGSHHIESFPGSSNGQFSNEPQTSFMFFKSSSGKTIEPSVASLNKVRSLLTDLIDEEMDSQILSYVEQKDASATQKGKSAFSTECCKEKLENIKCDVEATDTKRSSTKIDHCTLEASKNKVTHFKSAAGKLIEVSEENLKKVEAMFDDVLEDDVGGSRDEVQKAEMVSEDDLTKDKLCSPVLLDGSFVGKTGSDDSEDDNEENKLVDGDGSLSPVLNCSLVGQEKQQQSIEKSTIKLVATPVNSRRASFEEKVLSSPDWGEFPDLKSSQAALLENQGAIYTPGEAKENVGLEANRQSKVVEWVEFPEMLNVDVCKLEQAKNYSISALQKVSVASRESTPVVSGMEFVTQESTSGQYVLNSSVTVQRVRPRGPSDRLQDSESSNKRKSMPNSVQSVSKKSKQSLSPHRFEDDPNRLAVKKRTREQQCAIVRSKKIKKIQPSPGKLSIVKNAGCRWQLKVLDDELKTLKENHVEVGVSKMVFDITSENSIDYRFCYSNARERNMKFFEGDLIADSCLVAYADDNTAGLKEVTTAFLTSPSVDPKLIPNGWIRNHYRWIVWKLACLERTFPQQFGGSGLTLENVLLQLKYRYDREIDMVQRSSFKKLLEGDAAPNKFICCVASVRKNNLDEGESLLELELTDGWYSIWAVIDSEMVDLVKREVVGIGTKLIVQGAELANVEQGCDPLNVPSNVKLKISTNSTRRVKWFAKMGFTSNSNPIPALLCSVLPNGGLIGQVTAVVARKYPVIYLCKDRDGKTVFRNERSQALFREQQEKIKSERAEQVYEQVWKEVESKYRKSGKSSLKFASKEIKNITDPELLFNIMDGSDTEFIQSQLSEDQLNMVMQYKDEIMMKMKNDVEKVIQDRLSESEPASTVTKLLKVRLMDFFTEKHALLTIWRPSEDDLSVFHEGKAFEFLNLVASGTRDKVLQLSSTRQTTYSSNEMLEPSDDCARTLTPLQAVDSPGFTPTFGEIDVVGVVVLVKLPEQTRGVTVVYLSDLEGSYLSITFWTSLSVFGCEDLLTEGSVISCCNLQWRPVSNQRKIPSVFASEITSFSLNPKESHLHQGVAELKAKLAAKDVGELVPRARSHILHMTGFRDPTASPAPSTPPSFTRGTPAHKKLKLLSRVGEDAPPLSPIPLSVTTRHVFQNFKSPCRTPSRLGKSKLN